jgi:hypothetical protein
MYQMTDAAYAEAQGYCTLNHVVSENGCTSNGLDSRALPTRATEAVISSNVKVAAAGASLDVALGRKDDT